MARLDDAKDGLKAIAAHADALLDAYLNTQSRLLETEQNQPAIKSMLKHHLAWQIDPDEPVVLSRALTTTLDTLTRSYRISVANSEVGSLWTEMMRAVDDYQQAYVKGASTDADTFLGQAFELGFQLIESLRNALAGYSHYINSGFTEIRDLDLRAKANRRMVNRARDFNDVLESFDFEELDSKAGYNTELRLLLRKVIPRAIARCSEELNYAIGRLREMLHVINEQQIKTRLVEQVLELYERQDDYSPSLDSLDAIPQSLNKAPALMVGSRANPYHEGSALALAEIASKLETSGSKEVEVHTPEPVVDGLDAEEVELESNPIWLAAQNLIELTIQQNGVFSATKVYEQFDLPCSKELWLLGLVNAVNAIKGEHRNDIELRFVERVDAQMSGNLWVEDILLRRQESLK